MHSGSADELLGCLRELPRLNNHICNLQHVFDDLEKRIATYDQNALDTYTRFSAIEERLITIENTQKTELEKRKETDELMATEIGGTKLAIQRLQRDMNELAAKQDSTTKDLEAVSNAAEAMSNNFTVVETGFNQLRTVIGHMKKKLKTTETSFQEMARQHEEQSRNLLEDVKLIRDSLRQNLERQTYSTPAPLPNQ
jgi:chromosome segregation ATPase